MVGVSQCFADISNLFIGIGHLPVFISLPESCYDKIGIRSEGQMPCDSFMGYQGQASVRSPPSALLSADGDRVSRPMHIVLEIFFRSIPAFLPGWMRE